VNQCVIITFTSKVLDDSKEEVVVIVVVMIVWYGIPIGGEGNSRRSKIDRKDRKGPYRNKYKYWLERKQ